MLESRRFTKDMDCAGEVRRLYTASFPRNERMLWNSISGRRDEAKRMYVYFDEDTLVGFSYIFVHETIAYLGYLAVEEALRARGYGTKILALIAEDLPDYRICLDIEVVTREADNYEQRRKRKDFYLRNGYVPNNFCYSFLNVDYEILSHPGTISSDEFRGLIRAHWGNLFTRSAKFFPPDSDSE